MWPLLLMLMAAAAQLRPNITKCIDDALCTCETDVPNPDDCQMLAVAKADNLCWLHCCCKADNKGAAIADAFEGLLSAPIQSKSFAQETGANNTAQWVFPPQQRTMGATCDFTLQNEDPRVNFAATQTRARSLTVNDWLTPRPTLPEGVLVTGLYVSLYAYGGMAATCVVDRARFQIDSSTRDFALTQFVLAESSARLRRYGFLFTKQNLRLSTSVTLSRSSLSEFLSITLNFTRTAPGTCHVDCVEVQFVYENPILTLPLTETTAMTDTVETAAPNTSTTAAATTAMTSLIVVAPMDGFLTVSLNLLLGVAGGVVLLCALIILLVVCVLRKRNRERNESKRQDTGKQVELDGSTPRGNIYQSPPLARFSKLAEVSVGEYQNPEVSIGQYKNPEQISPAGGEYNVAEFTDAPLPKARKPTTIQPAAAAADPKERKKTFIQSGEAGGLYQSFQLTEASTDLKYVDLPEETAGKSEPKNPVVYETFDDMQQ